MKDGVTEASPVYRERDFSDVTIETKKDHDSDPYYHVTVSDKPTEPLVKVETYVRAVPKGGGA